MTIDIDGLEVDLYSRGDRICRHIAAGGTFEPDTLKFWKEICEDAKGETVLDVGSYTGLFSIIAAKAGAKPIAFEPMEANLDRLRRNASLNDVSIDARRLAVSDKQGTVDFRFNPQVKGLTSGGSLLPNEKRTERIAIIAIPLDGISLTSCAAIKVDVERGEANVLKGARRTIGEYKPTLIVEVLDRYAEAQINAEMQMISYRRSAVLDVRNWVLSPI